MDAGVLDDDHMEFEWSRWIELHPDNGALSELETDPGLYRVRHEAYEGLVYIGETGRSLRGRVRSLARGVYGDEMPFSDPHTASPSLWAIVDRHGPGLEVSGTTPPAAEEKQQRKALEDALIAIHRRETGTNLIGNFGRMPPGYSKSTQRSTGVRGGQTDDADRDFRAGVDPLEWHNPEGITDSDWMGLGWSEHRPLEEALVGVPSESGVYRLWDPDAVPPLEYVGESVSLDDRLGKHRRHRDGSLRFAYAVRPELEKPQLAQVESELLGAHWLATEQAPRDQY